MLLFLTPINDFCLECGQAVMKNERQELAWDDNDCPRRRCGDCIQKRTKEQKL
jgi:hypothetical protein